ncbi:MAG: HlyD family type I secretion periplasmic adaptor subunit [Pseudaminobacter sp.]|nr:HlyD family type I secretion periplasmic adaptor subunit [Pseudaminobacter sp.]
MQVSSHWARGVKTSSRLMSVVGLGSTAVFLLGFGTWASLAPLAGAAVAPGFVAAAGQNQSVQHLEGGIIKDILVREGEEVSAEQPLFELDSTAAQAQRNRIDKQLVGLSARAQRLVAERDGADRVAFPAGLSDRAEASLIVDVLAEQEKEFSARLERHRQELTILGQRVRALNEQIEGMTAQQTAVESQLTVVREETERKKGLLEQGLTNRSEYTALLRSEADLLGQLGQSKSSILAAKTQITEAQEQIARANTQRVETAATQLNDIRAEISDADEQLRAATAILNRVVIRSPSDGIIVKIAYNSRGSVVRPGEALLELLPTGDDLVIEARVAPQDVDVITLGQPATLRFSALNTRTTPSVDAVVTYLSADRLIDSATEQPYYTARLRINEELPPEIRQEQIYPGMPVETYIKTGERTFMEYLTRPLLDSFNRAFREE